MPDCLIFWSGPKILLMQIRQPSPSLINPAHANQAPLSSLINPAQANQANLSFWLILHRQIRRLGKQRKVVRSLLQCGTNIRIFKYIWIYFDEYIYLSKYLMIFFQVKYIQIFICDLFFADEYIQIFICPISILSISIF